MKRKLIGSLALFLVLALAFAWVLNSWYSSYYGLFGGKPIRSMEVAIGNGEHVLVESHLTGDPILDINVTLYHHYDRATIIVGTGETRDYCDRSGGCQLRTMAAVEVSCLVGKIFGAEYYEAAREIGYNDTGARRYAFEQVSKRVSSGGWLSFREKIEIGRRSVGNRKHLLVILRGPLDGAERNRIYTPREGVLVLEALSDETLYQEALLLEGMLGVSCSG
ncbi:hypothetical protein A3L09_09970 [Thermococcus profundus]|uniref:Uncharacterized protein n=1 Tax=Thermococcus profundus TaxID=49899 RepID=A0A2Z2MAX8_THEPR|nr:hypothetical protein [Thermococcus profundus]ASJ03557.1 hypothetical protein A3L09_09970 [Thermococcus profundus]